MPPLPEPRAKPDPGHGDREQAEMDDNVRRPGGDEKVTHPQPNDAQISYVEGHGLRMPARRHLPFILGAITPGQVATQRQESKGAQADDDEQKNQGVDDGQPPLRTVIAP